MTDISYDGKWFVGVVNYDDGDLTKDVTFHYRQTGNTVWGTFQGGRVRFGTLLADVLQNNQLKMIWQYLNVDGQFVSGECLSTPELLPDGRLRLAETWSTVDGPTGTSVIEEKPAQL
ncbi:MAG: n-acetylglutamate synthase [candidate division Zixibacteria bacterium]|nr:n-acetylglutamate synthase [candidate division Zixibacteria bacterium]MDH3937670.1 n-acetylglutamate synthase [candidate division Zixibacteria bacterium]MDH4033122.1 n-acetylglutamate synthase [candidate division Zixibacteria bacterium]